MKVFINCPFDETYSKLLWVVLFTYKRLGIEPCIATGNTDCATNRLDKIITSIQESDISFHDLSRNESEKVNESYRLNMAFELGIDYGLNRVRREPKKLLVVESKRYSIKKALSDYDGMDVQNYTDSAPLLMKIIRDWLVNNHCIKNTLGASGLDREYTSFQTHLFNKLTNEGFSQNDINTLPINMFLILVEKWNATA
jgi:hypothetical protein